MAYSAEAPTVDFSNPPVVYGYDREGIFTHTEICSPDHLESKQTGKAVWLMPANTTLVEPPGAIERHVRVFNNGAWTQVEDNRGTQYWMPGDTWQTPPREMKELGPLPVGATTVRPEKTEAELAAQAVAEAAMRSFAILMARMQVDMAQTDTFAAAEFATFAKAGLFKEWAASQTYASGYRLVHNGIVYEVVNDVTSVENQPPDASGMLAVYRPLSVDPDSGDEPQGTKESPIPFIYGMDVGNGLYYSYKGKLYLAKTDMPACVWYPGTQGLWQWEEVK